MNFPPRPNAIVSRRVSGLLDRFITLLVSICAYLRIMRVSALFSMAYDLCLCVRYGLPDHCLSSCRGLVSGGCASVPAFRRRDRCGLEVGLWNLSGPWLGGDSWEPAKETSVAKVTRGPELGPADGLFLCLVQ